MISTIPMAVRKDETRQHDIQSEVNYLTDDVHVSYTMDVVAGNKVSLSYSAVVTGGAEQTHFLRKVLDLFDSCLSCALYIYPSKKCIHVFPFHGEILDLLCLGVEGPGLRSQVTCSCREIVHRQQVAFCVSLVCTNE